MYEVHLRDQEGEIVDRFKTLEDISRLFKDPKLLEIEPDFLIPYLKENYSSQMYHGVLFRYRGYLVQDKQVAISINYFQASQF